MITAPLTYAVKVSPPIFATSASVNYRGKGTLIVTNGALRLEIKTGFGAPKVDPIEIRLDELRELRNELETKRVFRANFGGANGNIVLLVKIVDGQVDGLHRLFGDLAYASNERCPACAGIVENGSCMSCGAKPRAHQRKASVPWIVAGIVWMAASPWLANTFVLKAIPIPGTYVVPGIVFLLVGFTKFAFGAHH